MSRLIIYAPYIGTDPVLVSIETGLLTHVSTSLINKGLNLDISGQLSGSPIFVLGMYKKPIIVTRDTSYDYVYRLDKSKPGLLKATEVKRLSANTIKAITEARGLLFICQDDGIYVLDIETGDYRAFNTSILNASAIGSRTGADLIIGTRDGKVYYIDANDVVTDYTDKFGTAGKEIIVAMYSHTLDKWVIGTKDGVLKLASPDFATVEDQSSNWGVTGLGWVFDIPGLGIVVIHQNTVKVFNGSTWVSITVGITPAVACADYFTGRLILIDSSGKVEIANVPRLRMFKNTIKAPFTVSFSGVGLAFTHFLT